MVTLPVQKTLPFTRPKIIKLSQITSPVTIDALSIITLLWVRIVPLKGHSHRIDLMDLIYPSTKLSLGIRMGASRVLLLLI